ncbi:hypothetical protein DPEC_G00125970 [Dallia pectoralis]|uniref:Uncharacterized protein n=1 Tax=Dallia pectoralis TaxID=75939 RepID=A0ACC2GRY6_DALPE|nr:hypothetical protein DPEC_G00125970 [Dallia pectoralis]
MHLMSAVNGASRSSSPYPGALSYARLSGGSYGSGAPGSPVDPTVRPLPVTSRASAAQGPRIVRVSERVTWVMESVATGRSSRARMAIREPCRHIGRLRTAMRDQLMKLLAAPESI